MAASCRTWSVCIDLTRHMSSAKAPISRNSSDRTSPLLPYFLNLKHDPTTGSAPCFSVTPVMRCPLRTESGSSSPRRLFRSGFSSNSSCCDSPPAAKIMMTRFAVAFPVLKGAAASAGSPRAIRPDSAIEPRLIRPVPRKARRAMSVCGGNGAFMVFPQPLAAELTVDGRVDVQQRAADAGPGGGLGRVERLVDLGVAHGQELLRRGGVRLVVQPLVGEEFLQHLQLL